jgi:hypothetical protein
MANKKISELGALGAAPAVGDVLPITDVSGTATTKKVTVANLLAATNASADITGGSIAGITALAIADGGTAASTDSGARTNLGLGTAATLNTGTGASDLPDTNDIIGTQDMWIPAAAMRPASTNGCAAIADLETTATRPDIQTLDFDSSTQEYAQFSVAMPKSWNASTVTAQFYWTHATAVSTDVTWSIQGVCASDNDTIDIAYGTAVTVTDTFHNTAEDLAITAATTAVTLAGSPAAGDLAFFQVSRADLGSSDTTNSTDAKLIGVKINYTTSALNDA